MTVRIDLFYVTVILHFRNAILEISRPLGPYT